MGCKAISMGMWKGESVEDGEPTIRRAEVLMGSCEHTSASIGTERTASQAPSQEHPSSGHSLVQWPFCTLWGLWPTTC